MGYPVEGAGREAPSGVDLRRGFDRAPNWVLRVALMGRPFPLPSPLGVPIWCVLAGVHTEAPVAPVARVAVPPQHLQTVLEERLRNALKDRAVNLLSRRFPAQSARRPLFPGQVLALAITFVLMALMAVAAPAIAALTAGALFLTLSAFKMAGVIWRIASPRRAQTFTVPFDLPVYTVLVPLYREGRVVPRLLDALGRLDYPNDKLDIKLVVEEADVETQEAIAAFALPPWFTVVRVPPGGPKTKPKALNVALAFARGEFVVVYDAEDVPARDQLLRAVHAFATQPDHVVCLQAQLAFHSARHNWLTRQYAIEYALLFGCLLPLLSRLGLPFPLGGTSNHFRTARLKAIGGWDPFNVTEDADLGFRLPRFGLAARTLDSVTLEEPTTRLKPWLRQRTRWLKGFLQTWLVLMRNPRQRIRDLGPAGFVIMNLMMIGGLASGIAHPWFLLGMVLTAAQGDMPAGLFVFAAGHVMAVLAPLLHFADRGRLDGFVTAALTVPVHWLLVSIACYCAVAEFIMAPFRWNKTDHGSLIAPQSGFRRVRRSASTGRIEGRPGRIAHDIPPEPPLRHSSAGDRRRR